MRAYALSCTLVAALSASAAHAATWVNETNLALELDYCNLQFPTTFSGSANTLSPNIYGRVYEATVTETAGPSGLITAQVGYGPNGTDPRTDPNWQWFNASFNVQVGNDDEYSGTFTLPAFNGTYGYTYRFSLDGGNTLTAADLNGAGSNGGLTFEPTQMGFFSITDGIVPEPTTVALCSVAMILLARRR